jgi:hypothetical protein
MLTYASHGGPFVAYYKKKRQDEATYLSTSEENQGLAKEEKMKMSPFCVEGDRVDVDGYVFLKGSAAA